MSRESAARIEASQPPTIGGYEILSELGQGAMSIVYRARRGDREYALKHLRRRAEGDAVDMMLQFRREVAAIARLDHPALVRVHEVGEHAGAPYLVMDLVEGESLESRLRRCPLADEEAIAILSRMAEGLVEVQRFGLVHRDIKPANIMFGASGEARLIDFGLVSGAADEEAAVGTLHYAAPEQLGALKRAVGAPADMFALGATIFECLTGEPPLVAGEGADFVHQLLTTTAPDLTAIRPDTRPALAAIVSKLLARDPDDRYQSARGLLADLRRLDALDGQVRRSGAGILGSQDAPVSGEREIPLVGRTEELVRLERAWQRARRGQTTFAQIEGGGGSGKSRLACEFVDRAVEGGALILTGKCQEMETVPFGVLREAADEYAAAVLRLPDHERADAIAGVRRAAGEWTPLVRRLSVGMGRLLEDTGEMRALEPDAEQQRHYEALASFFRNLSSRSRPVVLAIDDVQWLDAGSLRVIARLASEEESHLLVLSTSRDQPQYQEARARYVEAAGPRLAERVMLQPLGVEAVGQIIAARLGGRPLDAGTVERLTALTNGNPFAVGEYLRALVDGGAVRLAGGRWSADPEAVDAMHLPADVAELVVSRLDSLASNTTRVACVAAVVGGRFTPWLIGQVTGFGEDMLSRALEELLRAGLVERGYAEQWSFVHDRVREAAVERMSETERRDVHQAIAEILDQQGELTAADLFAIARHYAAGHTARAPRRVAETNLAAGLRALEDHANEEAFGLLDQALEMARRAGIYDEVAPRLLEGLGRACAMTGRLDRAFEHLEDALRRVTDRKDRFRLQYLLTLTYASQGRNDEALESLYRSFEVLGRRFPRWAPLLALSLVGYWVMALLLRLTRFGYGRARGEGRERRQILSQLHYSGSMIALFQGRSLLMVSFIVRDFYNTHFLGATAETAIASSVYGAVLGMFGLKTVMKRYTSRGVGMAERLGDRAARSVALAYQACGHKWAGDLVTGNEMLVEALPELHRHVPGSWYAAMMICEQAYSYMHAGQSHATIEHVRANAAQLDRTNNLMFRYNTFSVQYAEMMLAGQIAEAKELQERLEPLYKPLANTIYVRLAKVMANLEVMVDSEEVGPEMEAEIAAFYALASEDYYSNGGRLLVGYARMLQHAAASPEERPAARRRLLAVIVGQAARAMVPVFKVNPLIWRAYLAREDGKLDKARRLLDRADVLADRAENRRAGFYIALERAHLARARKDASWEFYAEQAVKIAGSEGWRIKIRNVREEFGLATEEPRRRANTSLPMTVAHSRSAEQARRYADALLQVSLASASTLDGEALAKNALTEVARVLGAERALFFFVEPTTGELELKATTGAGVESISRTVVRRVVETRKPMILTGTDEGEALGSESIVVHGLRSIMAAPLMLRDRLLGVVYLDSRLAKGIFTEDDVSLLIGVSNHIAIALETARSARLEAERSAMQRDFELLGAVQNLLLPAKTRFDAGQLRGSGFYQPASQCGGDWWWYEVQPDGSVLMLLADVSGHGAAPAMITSTVASAFHTMRGLRGDATPPELLQELDRRVRDFGDFHMTMAVVRIDPATQTLQFWNAAAPGLFILRETGCECVGVPGRVLGDPTGFEIGETTVPFRPGDRLLACTDGVLELKRARGRDLGPRRVALLFSELADAPIDDVPTRLGAELNAILDGRPQDDDITFVVVEATDQRGVGPGHAATAATE